MKTSRFFTYEELRSQSMAHAESRTGARFREASINSEGFGGRNSTLPNDVLMAACRDLEALLKTDSSRLSTCDRREKRGNGIC